MIICHLFFGLKKKYLKNVILYIIKLLYSFIEAKNSLFVIYLDYYKEKLSIEILFYNTYLLITKDKGKNFSIARLQVNNIFNIKTKTFMNKKKTEIIKIKFKAKSLIILETRRSEDFNNYYMIIKDKFIIVIQKN